MRAQALRGTPVPVQAAAARVRRCSSGARGAAAGDWRAFSALSPLRFPLVSLGNSGLHVKRLPKPQSLSPTTGSARFVVPRLACDAGVDNNSVLRLKGSGDEGRFGGRPGDLYLSFVIRTRPDILRRGLDLISQVGPGRQRRESSGASLLCGERQEKRCCVQITVAYTDAILGSVYQVQTIRGKADLVIPAGTQHGAVLKLPGAGVQAAAGGSGECPGFHLFKVTVRLPVEVDNQDRRLLERLVAVQGQAC